MINTIIKIVKDNQSTSLMDLGGLLDKAGIKNNFSLAMLAHYTIIDKGNKDINICNKKYIDINTADCIVNELAIGSF